MACIAGALGIIVLPASMSRSAWAAFALALALWSLSRAKFRNFIKARKLLLALAAAAAVIVAAGAFSLKRDSALGRFHIWGMELRAIADSPLVGHGSSYAMGSYGDAQAEYFESGQRSPEREKIAGCPEYAFNEYLHIGMDFGVPAMLAFAVLLVFGIMVLIRNNSALAWGLVTWATFAFASYPLSVWQMCLLPAVMLGAAVGSVLKNAGKRLKVIIMSTAVIVSIAGISVWLPDAFRKRDAEKKWHDALKMASFGMEDGLENRLAPLYPEIKHNYRYLYDYGYALHKSGQYEESNDILREGAAISSDPMFYNIIGKNFEAMGNFDAAVKCWRHSHFMVPSRLYPYILLMEMYDRRGDVDKAVEYARMILEKPVNERNVAMRELKERAEKYLKKNEWDY